MMKTRLTMLAVVLATLAAGQAWGQAPPRIATIDLNKVFENYWKTKQAQAILKDRIEGIQKDQKDMQADLVKLNAEYDKAANEAKDPNISAEEKEKRQRAALDLLQKLKDNDTEMKNFLARADENIKQQKKRLGDRVLDEIKEAVSSKAKTAGFTYVLNSAAEGLSGPFLMFAGGDNANDITDSVLATLNAGAPADPAADIKKTEDTTKPDQSKVSTNENKKSQ